MIDLSPLGWVFAPHSKHTVCEREGVLIKPLLHQWIFPSLFNVLFSDKILSFLFELLDDFSVLDIFVGKEGVTSTWLESDFNILRSLLLTGNGTLHNVFYKSN